jgi:hypothetical protein
VSSSPLVSLPPYFPSDLRPGLGHAL